jgi:Zn ribbon nucleic-acid-binding protein
MSTPPDPGDDRAPICPACGVTQFLVAEGDEVAFVCVECGFSDESPELDA